MAFVFEKERQTESKNDDYNLGPGSYDYSSIHHKQIFGYISPETIIIKPIQIPNFLQQQIKQKNNDEMREAIRLMYLKTKIKNKHQKQSTIEKQNLQSFKGFVKNDLTKKQERMKKSNKKKQITKVIKKQKSIPSLYKNSYQGLCINNQTKKSTIKSAKINKINYKQSNQFIPIEKQQVKTQQQSNSIFIGQFISKNSKQLKSGLYKTTSTKPKQSLKKNIQMAKQLCQTYNQKSTVVQDLENSIQYIQNQTPGPGSYNLQQVLNHNKINRGFGGTVDRFPHQKITPHKYNLNINIPQFKKTTKASQNEVSFGSSTKDKINCNTNNQYITYLEDYNSIEHKSLKNLINSYNHGGYFLSKTKRFIEKSQNNTNKPISQVKQLINRQQLKYQKKPQSIFLSKVKRLYPHNQLTANVDFTGQQFNTIKNIMQEQLQVGRKTSPFLSDAQRFKCEQSDDRIVQLNANLKQQIESQNLKGYTFNKSQQKQIKKQILPFGRYNVDKQWVKPSFNIKFQAFDSV